MRISEQTINTIREQIDIVDVISNYLTLKRTGSNYRALCPFHSEKTPSFFVSPVKQIYHCFGCGKGGDLIKFVSEIEGINYYEAAIKLAREYNIPIEYEGSSNYIEYLKINKLVADFFHKNLLNNLDNNQIKDFISKRGLNIDLIEKFFLGYAKKGNNLIEFLKNRGIQLDIAEKLGLAKKNEKGEYYDYFRDRIIFPIRNLNGEFIGFGGRVISDDNMPKYLNSPDTPVYNKRNVLYGLFENKESIKKLKEVIFVEGYMDLITLFKYEIKNCVATCGTALTEKQVQIVSRFTDNIFFLYDGDKAGVKASIRASVICINQNIYPKIISLPKDLDPDDFLKNNGIQEFKDIKSNSKELADFLYEKIKHLDLNQLDIKLKVVKKIRDIFFEIDNPVYRKHFIKKFAEYLQLTEKELEKFFYKFFKVRNISNRKESIKKKEIKLNNEDKFTAFLLQNYNELKREVDLKYFQDKFNKLIIEKIFNKENILSWQNSDDLTEIEKERLRIYLTYEFGLSKTEEKENFFYEAYKNLQRNYYKIERKKLTEELKKLENKKDFSNLYKELLLNIKKLQEEERLLWN